MKSYAIFLDSCVQPIGMENGLITNDQIKLFDADDENMTTTVRLKSSTTTSCNEIKSVEVNLRRFMSITGFAFQSDAKIDGIIVRYGTDGEYLKQPWKTIFKYNILLKDLPGREIRV